MMIVLDNVWIFGIDSVFWMDTETTKSSFSAAVVTVTPMRAK